MSFDSVGEVFFSLCKGLDSPLSLSCWLLYKYGEHRQLAEKSVRPEQYAVPDRFAVDYLCTSFLSKYKGLKTGTDLEQTALAKFKESETQCRTSNERIRAILRGEIQTPLAGVFYAAQRKIARLLGPFSLFCMDGEERWGPHAALDISRRQAAVDLKMCKLPISVSLRARPYFKRCIERDLHWSAAILGVIPDGPFSLLPSCFSLEECCRIETVAKNAKTNRVIAVEPRGNGFLQKAVGAYIRKQLRKVGVNLNDQTVNQRAAHRALMDKLATLDLRAASDTVCTELVFALLPLDWAEYLNDLRSHGACLPTGDRVKLQKFSSMGNGFTFELESLIFWALCRACVDEYEPSGEVMVYGDDLVVPTSCEKEVVAVLQEAGFAINDDKSFGAGFAFRESCGFHYFEGHDVTPTYQKEEVLDECELIRMGNRILRAALRFGAGYCLDPRIKGAWLAARRLSTWSSSLQIPMGCQDDDAWLMPSPPAGIQFCRNRGYKVTCYKSEQLVVPGEPLSLLAYKLRKTDRQNDDLGEVRENLLKKKFESVATRGDDVSFARDTYVVRHRWVNASWDLGISW
jgi:hypothetical protein